jgi:hypothetical protein
MSSPDGRRSHLGVPLSTTGVAAGEGSSAQTGVMGKNARLIVSETIPESNVLAFIVASP